MFNIPAQAGAGALQSRKGVGLRAWAPTQGGTSTLLFLATQHELNSAELVLRLTAAVVAIFFGSAAIP